MSVPILIFQVCVPIKHHQRTLSFQIPHEADTLILGGMLTSKCKCRTSDVLPESPLPCNCTAALIYPAYCFVLIINNISSILRSEDDTILNHTDLYEYKHGKMLMHLKFCFESVPTEQTPAAMLKYYRQRKGLTTRQLAESVEIVPATLLVYEREQFPIPYQTAVEFADILEIDDFARFIDFPYNDRLHKVRKTYGLNQATFAEKAGISLSIYSKWEGGSRQPSRKLYRQLVTTYSEINI